MVDDISWLFLSKSCDNFLANRKTFLKIFQCEWRNQAFVISLRHICFFLVKKVSRMDGTATYNTLSTDDRLSNARKRGNSPFLSKKGDGRVQKAFAKVVRDYVVHNRRLVDLESLKGEVCIWNLRKNRKFSLAIFERRDTGKNRHFRPLPHIISLICTFSWSDSLHI